MKFLKKAVSWLLIVAMIFTVNIPAFAADITLPDNEAIRFVDKLGAAWNLGNAFDATGCTWLTNELDYESGWCGAKTTEKLITTLAEAGFKTIRIPVSWHDHVDSNNTISTAWINRVQEVVDWCIDAGMYVILNVHHDVEVGYYFPDSANYTTSEKFMKDVWKQISEKFKNYDNRLIFETINEPRLKGNVNYEWWFNINYPPTEILDSVDCINRLNQVALDTIRAAGGNNADRYVLIPGYDTSVDGLTVSGFEMPDDSAKNRLIANFHLYTMDESRYKSEIDRVYEKFVKNGIPAILSEFNLDPGDKQCYDDNSADYLGKFVAYARERGITCAIWDNNADEYKLINRADSAWVHKDVALSVIENGTREILVEAPVVSASTGDGTVKLTWNSVENAASYRVYRAESASGEKTLIGTPKATSYTDTSVTAGNTYYYFVTAYDSANAVESEYSSAVSVTVLNDSKIADFVERLYTKLLGRASDASGKANHINRLKNGYTAAEIGAKFVLSAELAGKKLTNREFVKRMYETFLDRTPSSAEITRWATTLDNGCSYAYILKGFVASAEFKKLAASYGITAGTYTPTENRDHSEKVTAFVSRMYTKALKRTYDVSGLNNHTGRIINKTHTPAQIAELFFFSAELTNKNLSNEEFVTRLYNALFDRNPDAGGMNRWLTKMQNGTTRKQVFNGFANSAEFKALVTSFGL